MIAGSRFPIPIHKAPSGGTSAAAIATPGRDAERCL